MPEASPLQLPEDIAADRAILPDMDPDNDRAESLEKLADALITDGAVSASAMIIEAAICVFEEILRLRPVGHVQRAKAVGDLGKALYTFCVFHEADHSRRVRCIELLREGLQLSPPGHSLHEQALHGLSLALAFVGYEQLSGGLDHLNESITLSRATLQLRPAGHPEQHKSLDNLAYGLIRSFHHCGDLNLLAESIATYREVLQLRPLGHPRRDHTLQNLASSLESSYQHQGGPETLAEQISLSRETLQLRPVGHPLRWMSLTLLGNMLGLSFELKGSPALLSESISAHREAVQLMPSTHPDPGGVLNNLAHVLVASFRQSHDRSALSEAITLLRRALRLPTGLGGDRRLEILIELAEALSASFDEHHHLEEIHEAVRLHREVLENRLPGHYRRMEALRRLGSLLCRTECQSWDEAFALYREALDVCPAGSPLRAELFSDISQCLLDPGSPFFDLFQGVAHLSEAYADNFCHVNRRLRSAMSDLPRVQSAYAHALTDLGSSALECADSRVLDLYAQVISLLPRAANFGLDHSTRLQAITGLDEISRDAAARALLLGRQSQALELLEEGRGVFWAQTLHLRPSAFDDVPQEDRQRLQHLLRLLESSSRRVESSDQNAAQRERDLEKRRQLNDEAEALIFKIRGYPGLDRFLLPPPFNALLSALPCGFVVIVNASYLGYHALLLHRVTGLATSLALKPLAAKINSADLQFHLPRDMGSNDTLEIRAMRKDSGRSGSFLDLLSTLWTSVVQPIISQLGLQKSSGRARPRLWWCVTGDLGFLPIHAAGDYHDVVPVCVADYVTSSYVPTLSALTKAKAGWKPIMRTQLAGLLVCEDSSNSERARYLPQVAQEVRIVRDCFESAHAQVLNVLSAHTSLSELRSLLENMPAHILHFACHGIHASDPLKSGLVLEDGNLTIQDIMDLNLSNAVLAVLSACQTAKGDRNAPDQAVHLAASMLFCGLKSIIGTMWLMHDADGPKVARAVYEALFRSEAFDLDDVPYALDEAVQELRKVGVPAQRWALFMHMGG